MSPAAKARLCAIWDCRVIRAPFMDPGFVELVQKRMAVRRWLGPFPQPNETCDFRITPKGEQVAPWLLANRP